MRRVTTDIPDEVSIEEVKRRRDEQDHFVANYKRNVLRTADELVDILTQAGHGSFQPLFAMTPGTGMDRLHESLRVVHEIDLSDTGILLNFRRPTVDGHAPKISFGYIGEKEVPVVMIPRTHYYEVAEGSDAVKRVIFGVDVMGALGIQNYFATHAAGGLKPHHKPGDIQIIADQIYLGVMGAPPVLVGGKLPFTDKPFVNMAEPYDLTLTKYLYSAARKVAAEYEDLDGDRYEYSTEAYRRGTLSGVTGRDFETPAEVRFLQRYVDADTVGMSMMIECKAARANELNGEPMRMMGLSLVTDTFDREGKSNVTHDYVLECANDPTVQERLAKTVVGFFNTWAR